MPSNLSGAPPISRLPTEILDIIFLFAFPSGRHFTILDDPLRQSRVVSHVCSRWRYVALLNSRLWNEVTFSKWRRKEILPWIEEIIHRSRRSPVYLRLWIGDGWDKFWDRNFTPLLFTLIHRVRHLDIRMDYSLLHLARTLTGIFAYCTFPILESISITPYNVVRRPVDNRYLDFVFPHSLPKLRRVEYDMNFDYVPLSALANITHFKLTSCSRYGNPWFSPIQCLIALRSMPQLEELHLAIDFNLEDMTNLIGSDEDARELSLTKLKHFHIHASCLDCAMILPYVAFPPGCTFDVTCTESEIDDAHGIVRLAVGDWAEETGLSMTNKTLEIAVHSDAVCITVNPLTPSDSNEPSRPYLIFNTLLRPPDNDSDEEDTHPLLSSSLPHGGEPIQYALLIFLARTMHRMKLTQAAEIYINIDIPLPIEVFSAPILGPFIRACTSATTLHLIGTENMFMSPFLVSMMFDTGRTFDEMLFNDLEMDEYDGGGWTPIGLLEASVKPELSVPPVGQKPRLRSPKDQTLKTIRYMYTCFDMTIYEGQCRLRDFLHWKERQSKIVDDLLWHVPCSHPFVGGDSGFAELTMADMIHHYLKKPHSG